VIEIWDDALRSICGTSAELRVREEHVQERCRVVLAGVVWKALCEGRANPGVGSFDSWAGGEVLVPINQVSRVPAGQPEMVDGFGWQKTDHCEL
jgi:hypothetical protein